jgi:predicted transcriptional regulator
VRQIQEALAPARELAYTTVVTMLTIMTNKKYVRRAKSGAGYAYEAIVKRDDASNNMLQDVVERMFAGSVPAVVQHLLETADLDEEELKTIRQLISRKQKEQQP